jgi:hypothetical protein
VKINKVQPAGDHSKAKISAGLVDKLFAGRTGLGKPNLLAHWDLLALWPGIDAPFGDWL